MIYICNIKGILYLKCEFECHCVRALVWVCKCVRVCVCMRV